MKKVCSLLLVLVMVLSIVTAVPLTASAGPVASGSCGPYVTYTLDSDGKLTISGTGETYDYNDPSPFDSNLQIKSIVIEPGVTDIGNYLFYNCSNVTSVRIPASVQRIGTGSFMNCSALLFAMIPDGVTSIAQAAFMNCTDLMCAGIPKTVTSIGASAFGSCENLWSVYYGGTQSDWQGVSKNYNNDQLSLASMFYQCHTGYCGDQVYYLFFENTGMLDVRGDGSTDDYAELNVYPEFYTKFREQIKEVYADQGVCRVGEGLFYDLPNVTYACVSDEVTDLGGGAFGKCTSLKEVEMSWSLTTMGSSAFADCTSLESIEFQEGLTEIPDSCFHNCQSLKSVTIPSTVTVIRDSAFNACTSLENVVIPEGVKTIMQYAFKFCTSLKNVSIPRSVTILNANAFNGASEDFTVTASCLHTKIQPILEGTDRTWNKIHNYQNNKTTVVPQKKYELGFTHRYCSDCHCWVDSNYTAPTGKLTLKHAGRNASAVKVSWNNVKTATGYQVKVSKDGKNWTTANLKSGVTIYTFKNLAAGTVYKFRARFYIKTAEGNKYSPWSSTLTSPTLPTGTSITKLKGAKKEFTAQWKKNTSVKGYQVQYSTNKKFTSFKTVTITNNKTLKTTVKKLSAKKTYYVRIRTYKTISGTNYKSAWSKIYNVKTK